MSRRAIRTDDVFSCGHLLLLLALYAGASSGCGPGLDIQLIESGHHYPASVARLGDCPTNERARRVLLELLDDDDAAVRCTAVRALRAHVAYMSRAETATALARIAHLLNDNRVSGFSKPAGWPLPAVDYSERLPSVRAEALITLAIELRQDLGFDEAAWQAAIVDTFAIKPPDAVSNMIPP